MSQIEVLNQDFSGNAYNIADYPEKAFVNWAANHALPTTHKDVNGRVKIANFDIQFCLATKDPMGNILSEPGVNRINHLSKGWPDPTTYTTQMTFRTYLDNIVKPQSIWDVTEYMNVWITDKSDLLTSGGVSTVPPLSTLPGIPNTATDKTDGIWCYTKSIGSYALYPLPRPHRSAADQPGNQGQLHRRLLDTLNDIVARQQDLIDRLRREVHTLREQLDGGTPASPRSLADDLPPHY